MIFSLPSSGAASAASPGCAAVAGAACARSGSTPGAPQRQRLHRYLRVTVLRCLRVHLCAGCCRQLLCSSQALLACASTGAAAPALPAAQRQGRTPACQQPPSIIPLLISPQAARCGCAQLFQAARRPSTAVWCFTSRTVCLQAALQHAGAGDQAVLSCCRRCCTQGASQLSAEPSQGLFPGSPAALAGRRVPAARQPRPGSPTPGGRCWSREQARWPPVPQEAPDGSACRKPGHRRRCCRGGSALLLVYLSTG